MKIRRNDIIMPAGEVEQGFRRFSHKPPPQPSPGVPGEGVKKQRRSTARPHRNIKVGRTFLSARSLRVGVYSSCERTSPLPLDRQECLPHHAPLTSHAKRL